MARCRHVLSHSAPAAATATAGNAGGPPTHLVLPPAASYATGPPRLIQGQHQPVLHPPFLSLTSELLALVASFLEGGHILRTLPLVAAPFADNVDVLIGLGTHSLLLHARNLFLLERLAPRLHSLSRLVIQGCRPLRCLGLDTPVTPRDDELLARFERVLATSPHPAIAHSLRCLTCDDLSLEDEAATACMGRILARLPRLTMLELPNAQISDRGMGQMLEALLTGCPHGEEAGGGISTTGYSVSCVTSLCVLDLADNMLEGASVLETILACFPSLRTLQLRDNFFPPGTVDATLRRLAPHLLLPTTPATPAPGGGMDQRRHPLLALPSSSAAAAAAAALTPAWPRAAPAGSPHGILAEEEMAASPLPLKRPAPTPAATTAAAAGAARPSSPLYTPSPCTTAPYATGRALASSAVTTGPTTPTRGRSSSSAAALTFGLSAASSSSGPPPGPSSTHPRRPVSYAERLMLAAAASSSSSSSAPKAHGCASPLERAMREEGEVVGMEEDEEGVAWMMDEGEACDDAVPLSPLQNAPPPKRLRRVGEGKETGDCGDDRVVKGGGASLFG